MSVEQTLQQIAPALLLNMKRGTDYIMIACPFHKEGQERTPSCSIRTDRPVFFCHACSTGGSLVRLLQQLGMQTDIAQTYVSSLAQDTYQPKRKGPYRTYNGGDQFRGKFILNEELLDDYRLKPLDLEQAGFTERTLLHFEVGFDSMRYRILYPIRDLYGNLVGMSGRTIIDEDPRYKIYKKELIDQGLPETYTMDSMKEAILWHAHIIYPVLFDTADPVIVVEGFKACMWVWQSGYHNVVALIGAYMSDAHRILLGRLKGDIILFLDNNEAGIRGTFRSIDQLLRDSKDRRIYVAQYPDDREQPDELSTHDIQHAIENNLLSYDWKREKHGIQRAREREIDKWKRPFR